MRYHYEPPEEYLAQALYGKIYVCDHEVYSECTLYKLGEYGLAVIQQRFNSKSKTTYWTAIDKCLVDEIYLSPGFIDYFHKYADKPANNLYPTVNVRQIMWALRMKPLKHERWETVFDRSPI